MKGTRKHGRSAPAGQRTEHAGLAEKCEHDQRFHIMGALNGCLACEVEKLMAENARLRAMGTETATSAKTYDRNFGDEATCKCGHPYCKHFDTYDDMAPVGCKYCECEEFVAAPARQPRQIPLKKDSDER